MVMADHRSSLEAIFREVLRKHEPAGVVEHFLHDYHDALQPGVTIAVAASGKSACGMARGAFGFLGTRIKRGLVISNDREPQLPGVFEYHLTSHPVPGERSVVAANTLINFVSSTDNSTVLLYLTSGGTSSMVSMPAKGITLQEKSELTSILMKNGIEIHDLNLVRSFFSDIKGGGLLRNVQASKVVNLIISDVVDNDLSVIGSGMLVPRTIDPRQVVEVLEKFGNPVDQDIIAKCINISKDSPLPEMNNTREVSNFIIDSNRHFVDDFAMLATKLGYRTEVLPQPVTGESVKAVDNFLAYAGGLNPKGEKPLMLIAGAETGVVVRGSGTGGRNSEFAMRAAPHLADRNCFLLAAGTDGIDGSTTRAGALVDGESFRMGTALGLDYTAMLANSDSGTWCGLTGSAIQTGSTGVNLADIIVFVMA